MSQQPDLDFTAPIAPSRSPIAKHCSALGAKSAEERIGRQCLQLLTAYQQRGPLTDSEASKVLGVERSTINARRSELVRRGLVEAVGSAKNPETGVRNTRWGIRR
jgi:Fic family protein